MKRTEAWEESMKRVEHGEFRWKYRWREPQKVTMYIPPPEREKRLAERAERTRVSALADAVRAVHAKEASLALVDFASDLDRAGHHDAAVEVRRFMYERVEPHTGGQCQS